MNAEQKNHPDPIRPGMEEDEINLLDYLLVLLKHKTVILVSVMVTFALACGITLMMPNIYTATTRVLPPTESKVGLGGLLGGMGELGALAGVTLGGSSADLYVGMLRSRTVADAIIDRFDLMTLHKQEYRVPMYTTLAKLVDISIGKKDGIIAISVDNEDPQLAAAIANAYVDELKKLNIKLNLSNAGRERVFLEERLEVVKADLVRAEDSLREFQEKNKAIRIDDQATAIIEAVSRLRGELASKEVELGVLLTSHTEQNYEVRALREGVGQLKSQLRRLEDSPSGKNISQDIFIATSDVPDLGIRYARLMRDHKVQETLLELLTRQHEMAKITEAKNTSTLQVLDEAAVPDRKSRPKRSFLVLGATGVSFVLSVFLAFALAYVARMPERERRHWREIRGLLFFQGRGEKKGSGKIEP